MSVSINNFFNIWEKGCVRHTILNNCKNHYKIQLLQVDM